MADEVTDYAAELESDRGAIPGLTGEGVLGAPSSRTRSKTNVSKLGLIGLILLGFMFLIVSVIIWQKMRKPSFDHGTTATTAVKPAYEEKNEILDSASIAQAKADIKKKELEAEAARKAEEEEAKARAAAEALAAEEAARLAASRAPARPGQPAMASGPSGQPQGPAPVLPPTPEERKMTGGVLLATTGAKIRPEAQLTEKEQKDREVAARMNAVGVQPGAANVVPSGSLFQTSMGGGGGQGGMGNPAGGQGGGDSLAGRLQSTPLQARSASRLPNLDYLLKKGTVIPCALNTGINTTLPGFVTCKALNDIYSANGKTLLVERGATFFGEQQSSIKEGQERTFVLWNRVDNPSGVFANIDSPATDQMGYSGVPGYIETYFWKRFGGAIMLSLIKDFSGAFARKLASDNSGDNSGNSNQNSFNSTQQATNDMAGIALRNSINIPPTLIVLPGTVVNVMVARDVSFENVYTLID